MSGLLENLKALAETVRWPELGIVAAYFALVISVAIYLGRRAGRREESFWGAGRQIGFVVNGFAQFAGLVSAASFLGFLGMAYKLGWSFTTMAFGVGSTLGFILTMMLSSGPLRRYSEMRGKFTLSSFFADRYGTATSLATSVFILILFPLYIIAQLLGGKLAAEYLLGIESAHAVVLVGVVFVGFVAVGAVGGMLSASWIDFLQGVLMYSFMIGLSIVAIVHFGGFGSLIGQANQANPHFLSLHPKISPWTYFGMSLAVLAFTLSSPHTVMRLFIVRSVKQGRAALSLTGVLSLTFHLLGYVGVAAAALVLAPTLATENKTDGTYLVVMSELFPLLLRGLAVAGILAAIMSTTGVILLAAGAEFSQNIYRRFIRPQADDRHAIRVARVAIVCIGVITTLLAMRETKSIGMIVTIVVTGTGSAFAVPLLAGLWWKRANRVGGLLSCVGGFAVFAAIYHLKVVPQFAEILISLPASALFMVVGSLLTAPTTEERVRFVESLHHTARPTPMAAPEPQAVSEPAGVSD